MTQEEFAEATAEGDVIVDFWAEWCGPCHAVSPVVEKLASDHNFKLVKVNIDESPELAREYGVQSIPMFLKVKDGEILDTAIGSMPRQALAKALGLD